MRSIAPGLFVRLLILTAGFALVACSGLKFTPEGVTTDDSSSTDAGAGDGASDATKTLVTTGGCMQDTASGLVLCRQISLCPDAVVNADSFPNCGYRENAGVYTLECLCYGSYLCSMGSATTCAQAKTLLGHSNIQLICNQIGGSQCLQLKPGAGTTSGGTTSGGTSTCDTECARTCSGSKSCRELCGC